jgi:hypothetical protein
MGNWLRDNLKIAKESQYCAKIVCTTCGAIPFQRLLVRELVNHSSAGIGLIFEKNTSEQIQLFKKFLIHNENTSLDLIAELKNLTEADIDEFSEYLRYILVILYANKLLLKDKTLDGLVSGTPIGDLLSKMKQHQQERLEFKKLEYIRNDPELARVRREQRKAERALSRQKGK